MLTNFLILIQMTQQDTAMN